MKIEFEHIGIASSDQDALNLFLTILGYNKTSEILDPLQDANLSYFKDDNMPSIEIVSRVSSDGPVSNILKKNGAGIYHFCLKVESISGFISLLKEKGIKLIEVSKPKESILFDRKNVSFYYSKAIGLFELVEG